MVEAVIVCNSVIRCKSKRIRIGNGQWYKSLLICFWGKSCNHKKKLALDDALLKFGYDKDVYYADSKTKKALGIIHKDRYVGVRFSEEEFQKLKKNAKTFTGGNMSAYIRKKTING